MEQRRFPKIETFYSTLHAMQARFEEEERPDRLRAETLETKAAFSHREFTKGHKYFCVNDIHLEGNLLTVGGFMSVWDFSVKPPRSLPNLEFAHCIEIELDP